MAMNKVRVQQSLSLVQYVAVRMSRPTLHLRHEPGRGLEAALKR